MKKQEQPQESETQGSVFCMYLGVIQAATVDIIHQRFFYILKKFLNCKVPQQQQAQWAQSPGGHLGSKHQAWWGK